MSFESALQWRIYGLNLDGVGEAVVWGRRLPALPSIQLTIIADARPQHFKGFVRTRRTEVQVNAWARSAEAMRMLREALIDGLVVPASIDGVGFQRAMITAVRSGGELRTGGENRVQPEIHRASIDFSFWHNGFGRRPR